MRKGAMLDLVLTNEERLVGNMMCKTASVAVIAKWLNSGCLGQQGVARWPLKML